jgi:hypothetical protein
VEIRDTDVCSPHFHILTVLDVYPQRGVTVFGYDTLSVLFDTNMIEYLVYLVTPPLD